MLSIVVARYNEDIEWLNSVKEYMHLYNKGPSISSEGYASYHELPNVGREAHTYLQYIIDNYHNLPPVVCFTQAKISDHTGFASNEENLKFLINLMNSAVTSETGYSNNFTEVVLVHKHNGPSFNIEHDDLFFLEDKNYNSGMKISFKDWFEKTLRIEYPNKMIHSCNAIFAIRSDLIKRRSLNFYKSLINEVNKINSPVEARFFELAWYYIFQGPISDLDAIYFCSKTPFATYKTLEAFKKYHPFSKVFLISDNGYDYTEMAKHFNCEYTHLYENTNTIFGVHKNFSIEERKRRLYNFINIFIEKLQVSTSKFMILLEDDVTIQGPIETKYYKGMINGAVINRLPDYFYTFYYINNPTAVIPSNTYFSGHGGSVFNCEQLLDCLTSRDILEKVIETYIKCSIMGGVIIHDILFSLLAHIKGYNIINMDNHMEVETHKYSKSRDKCNIIHQVKDYYNIQMPTEIAHLVKET